MRIGVVALQGAFAEHEKVLNGLGVSCVEVRQRKGMDEELDGLVLPGGESTVMAKLLHDLDLVDPLQRAIGEGLPVFGTCAGMIVLARKVEGRDPGCLPVLDVVVRRNAFGRQLGSFRTEGAFRGIGTVPMTFIRAPFVVTAGPDVEVLATVEGGTANIVASSGNDAVTVGSRVVSTVNGLEAEVAMAGSGAASTAIGPETKGITAGSKAASTATGPRAKTDAATLEATAPTAGDGRIVAVRQGSVLATAFHPELTGDTRVHEYFIGLCAAR